MKTATAQKIDETIETNETATGDAAAAGEASTEKQPETDAVGAIGPAEKTGEIEQTGDVVEGSDAGAAEGSEAITVTPANPDTSVAPTPKARSSASLRSMKGGTRSGEVVYFPVDRFKPLGHNRRDWSDPANIEDILNMAATVNVKTDDRKQHIREALVVIPDAETGLLLIEAGETRWRTVMCLEGKEFAPGHFRDAVVSPGQILLPCVAGDPSRSHTERLSDLVTHQGRGLRDFELAEVFIEMMNTEGWTQKQVADAVNRQQTFVSQILSLHKAAAGEPKIKEALAVGRLAPTTVVNAFRDYPDSAAATLLGEIDKAVKIDEQKAKAGTSSSKSGGSARRTSGGGRTKAAKPTKITMRQVAEQTGKQVVSTRNPRAFSKENYNAMLVDVQHWARYSADPVTREGLNNALKRLGYHDEPCLVDEKGVELPNAAEIQENHEKNVSRYAAPAEASATA